MKLTILKKIDYSQKINMTFRILLASIIISAIFFHLQYGINNIDHIIYKYNSKDIIVYCIFSLSLSLLFLSKNKIIDIFVVLFAIITNLTFIGFKEIVNTGQGFNKGLGFEIQDANLIITEAFRDGAVSQTIGIYSSIILFALIKIIIWIILIYIIVFFISPRIKKTFFSYGPITFFIVLYLIYGSGAAVDKMPTMIKVPMQIYRAANLDVYRGERDQVKLKASKPIFNKIVYIVDESVLGKRLGLNNPDFATTPFLKSIRGKIHNYGIATSGSNCSSASNILLQTGILPFKNDNRDSLGILLLKRPNLFQYAKKAGYKVIYIDGQLKGGMFQNYMRADDFKYIDDYIQVRSLDKQILRYNVDMRIAEIISEQIKTEQTIFMYVLKSGVHFPYEDSYPEKKRIFKPTAKEMAFKNKEFICNSYDNSLYWNVDIFFKKLYEKIKNDNSLIIYTSDHGQNLLEENRLDTHCSRDPLLSELNVPFFAIALGEYYKIFNDLVKNNISNNQNLISHFNIFPTILVLEGYKIQDVKKIYGKSILGKTENKRYYISSLVLGGNAPILNYIE